MDDEERTAFLSRQAARARRLAFAVEDLDVRQRLLIFAAQSDAEIATLAGQSAYPRNSTKLQPVNAGPMVPRTALGALMEGS